MLIEHPDAGVNNIVPGRDETPRVNGPATLTTDPELLAGFTEDLRAPKMALMIETAEIHGHRAKAFRRGPVWDPDGWRAVAAATDPAEMDALARDIDRNEMRSALEQTYDDDLAADRAPRRAVRRWRPRVPRPESRAA